jgi:AraC-like DNA-binding protein
MQFASLLFIGFSLGAALLLLLGNLLQQQTATNLPAKLAGLLLIVSLAAIQVVHGSYLFNPFDGVHSIGYLWLLFSVAPSFYFYSRQLLTGSVCYRLRDAAHLAAFVLILVLPYALALPAAFVVGSGYLLWLAKAVYRLRRQRQRFHLELLALAVLFAIAVAVIVLGFVWPLLTESAFISVYSQLIGLAFFCVTLTLLRFPSLTDDVSEAVQATYAESTLKNVDKIALLTKLDQLMQRDKLYTLETLNLGLLAEQLGISQHQLSELINTEFQQGFSRYIRQHRIDDAKQQLLDDPRASVLSIGLSVGFSTQSNFYAAFRDIVGMAPGQFRKQHGVNGA